MLHTYLTSRLQLRYPIVGAPMAGAGGGKLAGAISRAGGIGIIGVGSEAATSMIETESSIARGDDGARFGIGLMVWAIERRPELLDAAIATRPALLSLSFGSLRRYADRVRREGIWLATQVNSMEGAREAEAAGADMVVAQGTEAGGHTGRGATLPLLQEVLEAVRIPVLAAGGIGSARGLAAALAAGADGAWIGTAFLACPETLHGDTARARILAARPADTVLTSLFDRVQGFAWPPQFPGRALRNAFADRWHDRMNELGPDTPAGEEYRQASAAGDYDTRVIYAGEAVGLLREERPAADVVRDLGEGAELLLRERSRALLEGPPP